MSDNKQKYESSNAQGSQTWYPGPGIWSGMAAPWYAYPGWGCGYHPHHPAEIAQQPTMQGAQWIGPNPAYLLTNETVQKNLMTAGVKLWSALQGCVEEMKERFRDAEAEAHASEKR